MFLYLSEVNRSQMIKTVRRKNNIYFWVGFLF